jgi:hypothetical protein
MVRKHCLEMHLNKVMLESLEVYYNYHSHQVMSNKVLKTNDLSLTITKLH